MVALLPLTLMTRDLFLSAGIGFLLAVGYRAGRLLFGNTRAVCFVCDAVVFIFGAVLYRAAAVTIFASGVMRWYTVACLLAVYSLVNVLFAPILFRVQAGVRYVLAWPFVQLWKCALFPLWMHICAFCKKMSKHGGKKHRKPKKQEKKSLQSPAKVLYNSK